MKPLRTLLVVSLLALVAPWASAQMVTSPLASPELGSSAGDSASEESPFSDRFNPASSAGKQRVTFDASYFGLVDTNQSGYGNAFNLGLTAPQRWGVVSGTVSYLGSTFNNFNVGNQGRVTLDVSKDLWEDFYVGANVDSSFGTGGVGVGVGVGFLQFLGDWGWAKDFRWGAALLDMGSAYTVQGISSPAPFTPSLGAQLTPWKDKKLTFVLQPDLSFPSFQDINLSLGSTVSFGDNITVNLAYRFDLRDTEAGTANSMPFSFGVGFHFFTDLGSANDALGLKEKGWDRSEVRVNTAAVPLTGGVWALGAGANIPLGAKDTTPPVVSVDQKTTYISPTNHEGVRNSLVLPVSIVDERYVVGYTLKVLDANHKVVRTIQNNIQLPEAQGLDQIWNRLTYLKHGVDIPKALEWNGTTDAGSTAPDGTYSVIVTAWDDNGNTKDWPAGTVVVKTVPPQAAVSVPVTEFNPVGPRNTLNVVQRGSSEGRWTGTFADSRGQTVLTKTWNNAAPDSFDWDGKGNDGKVVSDGVYSYSLAATDLAGNATVVKVGNLIVNSIPTPLDLKLTRTAFSPGGNGVKTLGFQPLAGVSAGMTGWKLEVQDTKGSTYRTLTGVGVVPPELSFDGKDESGTVLSEGPYHAKLTLTYSNGNTPQVDSPAFTVKNTPPKATVSARYSVFSPGSEEGRGVLVFDQTSTPEDDWTGTLTDGSGKVLRTVRWPGSADATYLWDGRGADGNILPDGTYFYHLEAVDQAGNTGVSPAVSVQIDTAQRSVLLASDRSAFTPISAGPNHSVKFLPQFKEPRGLASWTLVVQDAGDKPVRTWSGTTTPPGTLEWDGKTDQGQTAPDGTYSALLKTTYGNGTTPDARSNTVVLKNTLPTVTVSADATIFSPTPDSARPTLTLKQTSSVEAEWVGTVSKNGTPVKTFRWKGVARDAVWDGTDNAGNKVADGVYKYEIKTTDIADNTVSQSVDQLTVDTRSTPLFLTVGADGFSPNGTGSAATLSFSARVGLNEGVDTWKLEISNNSLGLRKTFTGRGPVPAQWVWDGTTDRGNRTEDGRYSALLSVQYAKGNHPQTRSTDFIVQAGPPQLALELTPQPFSPDNDGYNDELLINLGVKSFTPVAEWSLEILDPEGHRFILFSGTGAPSAQLKWDGRSGTGELVQSASDYKAIFTAKDTLGNSASVSQTLSVDVLVIKDGDRLRIIIPSITFAPSSADFLKGIDADKIAKNVAVLKRLAEIFTKYQRYKIGIEGHAVMLNWADAARGQKEQESELVPLSQRRADAVRDYLVTLGIATARISTQGLGGAKPIVPFSDVDNRWKDRRVEFWLDRE